MSRHLPELPSELWVKVFEQLIHATVPEYILFTSSRPNCHRAQSDGNYTHSYSWTQVAHVCHYWRNCALYTPHLWAHIDTYHINAAEMFLERSKSTRIKVSLWNCCPDTFVERLLEPKNVERIEALSVDYPNETSPSMALLLCSQALRLEAFRYTGQKSDTFAQPGFNMGGVKMLTLKGMAFPEWKWAGMDLEWLHLESEMDLDEILYVLAANPRLRYCRIIANNSKPARGGQGSVVKLNCVQKLDVFGPERYAVWWMQDLVAGLAVPEGLVLRVSERHFSVRVS